MNEELLADQADGMTMRSRLFFGPAPEPRSAAALQLG